MDTAALRLVLLNTLIAVAAVVATTALTMYLQSCGVFEGERGDCDFAGQLYGVVTFALPALWLLAAGGIAYGVLVVVAGSFVPVSRLMALVTAPLAAVPLALTGLPNPFTLRFVVLVGPYCLILGLLVRLRSNDTS